jgi:hypothetical protein
MMVPKSFDRGECMNEEFQRKMQMAMLSLQRRADEELADVRQDYYSKSVEERRAFKQYLESVAQAAEPFNGTQFTVKLHFVSTWHCDEESVTFEAQRTPQEILDAIAEWESVHPEDQASEFFG